MTHTLSIQTQRLFVADILIAFSVCDDHVFKDEMLFYRFRTDDHSLPITHDIALVLKGYNISQRLVDK